VPTPRQPRAALRRARERKIVDATRSLFDERGRQDARIDRIARRVGINKALIYRHFASKEELFVLTTTRYLAEINVLLEAVDRETGDAPERLRRGFEGFADYGIERLYRDVRIFRIYEGTSQIQQLVIARAISGIHIK